MKPTSLSLTGACLALAVLTASCSKELKSLQTATLPPTIAADPAITSIPYGYSTGTGYTKLFRDSILGATTTVVIQEWAATATGEINQIEISVGDTSYVMVGGGAAINPGPNSSQTINSVLTAAFPLDDGNFSTYVVANKDHQQVYVSTLTAYVIGMKLYTRAGTPIPRSAILPHMFMASVQSLSADHPIDSIQAPHSSYTILSGGAFDDYGSGQGNMLVEDDWDPIDNYTIASGKDQVIADPCTIFDYALAIDNNPISGFGLLRDTTLTVSVPVTTHMQSTGINFPGGGWAPCGIGAKSTYTGAGRLLCEMWYSDPSEVTFSSKDQVDSDISGTLSGIITFVKPAQ